MLEESLHNYAIKGDILWHRLIDHKNVNLECYKREEEL